jgi:hypothetical protein
VVVLEPLADLAGSTSSKNLFQAINEAMDIALARDPRASTSSLCGVALMQTSRLAEELGEAHMGHRG